jgi:FKBP-type peptidyl-prolyl cis-trans isomerase FklB
VTDKVKVNYEGRLIDGTVFDASSKHGSEPAEFLPNQVIAGWTEALTMMPVGSKWQLYIPQQLAYGERNMGNIKPYSTLIFDVELVDIVGAKKEELAKEEPAAKNKKTKKGKK